MAFVMVRRKKGKQQTAFGLTGVIVVGHGVCMLRDLWLGAAVFCFLTNRCQVFHLVDLQKRHLKMSKRTKYPFAFGEFVEWRFETKNDAMSGHKTVDRFDTFTTNHGRVVGFVRRKEGHFNDYSFEQTGQVLLVQVRRGLTNRIIECFPEDVKACDKEFAFPDKYMRFDPTLREREAMKAKAAQQPRGKDGRFAVHGFATNGEWT